jgi:uncharacterized protein (DUF1330 family)
LCIVAGLQICPDKSIAKLAERTRRNKETAMPAWMIVTAKIHDRDTFIAGYGAQASKLVEQFGGRYVVRGPGAEQLEGEGWSGSSVVVSEWPSRAAALAFWNSPEYAEAKLLRAGLADCSILLVGDA